MNGVRKFFDLSNDFFLLAAYGNLDRATKGLTWHEKKVASMNQFDFNQNSPVAPQRLVNQNSSDSNSLDKKIAEVSFYLGFYCAQNGMTNCFEFFLAFFRV